MTFKNSKKFFSKYKFFGLSKHFFIILNVWIIFPFLLVSAIFIVVVLNTPVIFWLDRFQSKAIPIKIIMANGSLLKGSGLLAVISQSEKTSEIIVPGRFSWELKLIDVLSGKFSFAITQARLLSNPVYISVSNTEFMSSATTLRVPVSIFQAFGAPFSSLKVAGYADVSIQPVKISTFSFLAKNKIFFLNEFDIKSTIYFQDRHVPGLSSDIGKYFIDIKKVSSDSLEGSIKSLTGPLDIEGNVKITEMKFLYNFLLKQKMDSKVEYSDLIKSLHGKYNGEFKLPFVLSKK